MKDDRGALDLTKQIDTLKETLKGYKILVDVQQKQIWELKKFVSEDYKNKNLLQGYQKVIEDLVIRSRK